MESAESTPSGFRTPSPPMLHILPWFEPSTFELLDSGRYAHLRLRGSVRPGSHPQKQIELVVCRGERCQSFVATSVNADRHGRIAWEFSLPPAILEDRSVSFRLLDRSRGQIELPEPIPALIISRASRLSSAAMASAAALAASALMVVPAASLADGSNPVTVATDIVAQTLALTTGSTVVNSDDDTGTTTTDTTTTDGCSATTGTGTDATTTDTTATDACTTTTGTTTTTTTTTTGTGTTTTGTGATTTGTTTGAGTTTTGSGSGSGSGKKHAGGGSKKSSTGKLSSKASSELSSGISAGTGALSMTGSIKKTSALKSANGNAPAPAVLEPISTTALSGYTIGGGGGGIYSGTTLTDSWGGGMITDPITGLELARFAQQVHFGDNPPKYLVKIYKQAAKHYRIPWEVLAAINYRETDYGTDLGTSTTGAQGWMEFEPATWTEYGEAVSRTGHILVGRTGNPYNPRDAIFSAAKLLVADGARHDMAKAVFGYNHAGWYVQEVLTLAERITAHRLGKHPKPKQRVAAMLLTAKMLQGITYVWGGGHTSGDWVVEVGYDCSGFVSAVLHAGGFLKYPQTTQTLPSQAGIELGAGRHVTIYDRTDAGGDDHVIVRIDGQLWEEGGGGPSGADEVHRMHDVAPSYLASFNLILHPKGL